MSHPVRQPRPHDSLPSLNCELPYAQFVNLDVEIADGILVTVLRKDPTNIGNPLVPMIHGGVVGALLEHAALMQLCHELNLGLAERPKIINLSIDYLRPCLLADTFAQGTIVRRAPPRRERQGRGVAIEPATDGSRPPMPTFCCVATEGPG